MFEDLIKEYRETGAQLKKAKRKKQKESMVDIGSVGHINSMIRDIDWVIGYLETGYNPDEHGNRHGREVKMEPLIIDSRFAYDYHIHRLGLTDNEEKRRLFKLAQEIISVLTPREREAFWLIHVECLSHRKAAVEMGINKGSIFNYLVRAQGKIRRLIAEKEITLAEIC